jgi:hypothetical protein
MQQAELKELSALAKQPDATPDMLRAEILSRCNGSLDGHPLIVHAPGGPAMRIELVGQAPYWVSVPETWLQLER